MAISIGAARSHSRPYARAIYELAQQEKQVAPWQKLLTLAGLILEQAEVQEYVANPKVSSEQATRLVLDILDDKSSVAIKNIITLLADARKLNLLPTIAKLFISYVARDGLTETVTVRTASELDVATKEKLAQTLAQRLHKKIDLEYEIDPTLIGGATIRTEQWVLDGSVQGQLQQLKQLLTQ
jgi:F-type H+-transporting ATPase subunit delta